MIKYKLKCNSRCCLDEKEFDGWFQNIEAYEKQKLHALINCPICGSADVVKSLTTPSLKKINKMKQENETNKINKTSKVNENIVFNENLKNIPTILRTLKKEIQKNSTFVGDQFVSKVRSMKQGKIREKSIYGHGTNEEIQELRDEGIDVINIPWISDDH